jgi:hypothetical protein
MKNPSLFNIQNVLLYLENDKCAMDLDNKFFQKRLEKFFETDEQTKIEIELKAALQSKDITNNLLTFVDLTIKEFIVQVFGLYPDIFSSKIVKCLHRNFKK